MDKQKIIILYAENDSCLRSVSDSLKENYSDTFSVQEFDIFESNEKNISKIKNKIINPQILGKHGGKFRARAKTRIFFKKHLNYIVKKLKEFSPNFILLSNYFLLQAALQYKRKFNRVCKVIAYNTEFINHKWWENKNHIYIVNNETAFFDAFGKKGHSPALVKQVSQRPKNNLLFGDKAKIECRNSLGIKEDEFCLLVDRPTPKTYSIIKKLSLIQENLKFYVITNGTVKEKNICAKLEKEFKNSPLKIEFVSENNKDLFKYFTACDIFFSSKNYAKIKTAILSGTPILIYSRGTNNPLSRLFVNEIGAGVQIFSPNRIKERIKLWIKCPYKLSFRRENAIRFCTGNFDGEEISKIIYEESKRPIVNVDKDEYTNMLYELAEEEKFDACTTPININNSQKLITYDQLKKRGLLSKTYRLIVRGVVKLLGPIIGYFGFKIKITGRRNLRGIKSGITISNHVHYIDCLWNFQALSHKKNVYITGSPYNFKKGLFGATLKAGGFIPIATSFSQKKEFAKFLSEIFEEGGIVHFYPEETMWFRYEQSRPLKKGAFYHASKNNVPIIPMVFCFRKMLLRRKKAVTVKICKPIYPNLNLSETENCKMMRELAQQEYDNAIIEFYKYDKENYAMNKVQKQ